MCGHWAREGWRAAVAVALVVAAAWVAVALVPHAVGGFGNDPVVTDPGPPPSVDAFRDDQRKRYGNRVANRVFAFAPLAVPVVGAFAGAVAVGGRRHAPAADAGGRGGGVPEGRVRDGDVRGGEVREGRVRDAVGVAARVAVGATVGCAVGYALFVAVGTQAYAEVPGGYLLESYPPTVSAVGVATNAVGVSAPTAVGAFLAALAAASVGRRGVPTTTDGDGADEH
jgi:hypothetical protein